MKIATAMVESMNDFRTRASETSALFFLSTITGGGGQNRVRLDAQPLRAQAGGKPGGDGKPAYKSKKDKPLHPSVSSSSHHHRLHHKRERKPEYAII